MILAGSPTSTQQLGADGDRALITTTITIGTTTYSQLALLNTTTGTQIGTPVILAGSPTSTQQLGADGDRALITTTITIGTNTYRADSTGRRNTLITEVWCGQA